jgi:predicted nucleotidyltransferase component of viral defense system
MGAGISLSKTQIDSIFERHRIQMSFDHYIQTAIPYIDGFQVYEDFSVEEAYWKQIRAINRRIHTRRYLEIFERDEVSYKNRIFAESIGRSKFS